MRFDQVTPMSSFCPERHYICNGKVIICYKVACYEHTTDGTKISFIPSMPLWKFELPTEEAAQSLMEDLYYGEYTGA